MAVYVEPVVLPAASGLISAGAGRVMGWAIHNTSLANPAHVRLWDSSISAAGKLLVPISLTADQSTRDWLAPHGLTLFQGCWFELVDGAVEGSVWLTELPDESLTTVLTG